MRTIAILLICLCGFQIHAELDTKLMRQINSWRKGDAAPARLLKFPEGKIDTIPECGLRAIGSEVVDYIREIQNADLLAALIFDTRAQVDTFRAAVSQLIELRGVDYAARLLSDRRAAEPEAFTRSELAVLSQLLRAPYIAVQVARIAPKDMPPDKARRALRAMRVDLQAGASWANAYRKHSELHPDRNEPKNGRTVISYLYDSTISPTGFDIITYTNALSLPLEHLRGLFRLKRGTHILTAPDGVYLYHIQRHYDGAP